MMLIVSHKIVYASTPQMLLSLKTNVSGKIIRHFLIIHSCIISSSSTMFHIVSNCLISFPILRIITTLFYQKANKPIFLQHLLLRTWKLLMRAFNQKLENCKRLKVVGDYFEASAKTVHTKMHFAREF